MIEFTVNGEKRQVDVVPEMPLLWVLRDELGITGPKYGCGVGDCHACTIIVDGEALRSCLITMAEAEGRQVVTIEGLSPNGTHPLQQAWMVENVAQCGYCQVGQIMSAAALLQKTKKPSDKDIDDAMSGNVCRCGTYNRIRAAIHRAAEEA